MNASPTGAYFPTCPSRLTVPSPPHPPYEIAPEATAPTAIAVGQLWTVDASGLDPAKLSGDRGRAQLAALFDALIDDLDLHPVAPATWHVFPPPHEGVTGLVALSESHLSCHSFPEHAGVTIDLYTCRSRPVPDWDRHIEEHLGSGEGPVLHVQSVQRSFAGAPAVRNR